MVASRISSASERFVAEAARLFSTQGYAATSVADIQLACGVRPGSGALYKHFRSKQALLEQVVDVHVATMRAGSRSFREQLPDDLTAALQYVAQAVWSGMRRDREALRILLRDLDGFPELLDGIWSEVRRNVYDEFAGWLREQSQHNIVQVSDPDATAAVLLASLTHHPVLDSLIGHTPGDVDADRFARAWVEHALATLAPTRTQARSPQVLETGT